MQHHVNAIVLCATNEGDLYPKWCAMARNAANTPDSEWADVMRDYVRRLWREKRYTGHAAAITPAAMAVRDYYLAHVKETDQ